ncbi:MAG: efflux RND transporter periplasmic adaptor subunit [Candidatus Competibacteraceae bacterium]|nr:efflux RND transporter periplasmic adaptor subunit [Candidatus Competibacteraceae bacterium]
MDIKPQNTPAVYEVTGKTESSRAVEIRARVEGYLDKITYTEGDYVRKGKLLFQIDPKPFQAALDSAKGDLARAEAQLANARATLARVRPLAKENALSPKDLDDSVAATRSAQAQVQSAKAQVRTAQLNLGYTTITSPLNGVASKSVFREGSLVTPGTNSLLTTVVQLNPMWVNFGIGENEVLKFRQQKASGQLQTPQDVEVELVLANGAVYPQKGRIDYVAPSIDAQTGTLPMRATIPNPKNALSPSQFVRVRLQGVERLNVILVPQRAIMQGAQGKFVYVLSKDNKAKVQQVQVGDFVGEDWIVTSGLNGGERVIVDGAVKVRPDAPVKVTESTDDSKSTDAPQSADQ